MPTIVRVQGYRIYFFSHEPNEPPHVHIDRERMSARFWIEPVALTRNRGFSPRELRQLERLVEELHTELMRLGMSILATAADERVAGVETTDDEPKVSLMGGRTISAPLVWYPRLLHATDEQRRNWEIASGGYGIHGPDIDEDLSTEGLLRGAPAPNASLGSCRNRKLDTESFQNFKFIATPEKGEVSALLLRPDDATHLLVVGHGASSNMRTPMMQSIAEALARQNIATFRYNFPYSENGRGRDSNPVCFETIRSAVEAAHAAVPDLPLLAGGHSFSGRMTTTAASEEALEAVKGIVLFAFPLHPAGAPDTKRAEHLKQVTVPMLFLSGTRDALGDFNLLKPTIKKLGKRATLHLLDTADHSFKTQKTKRTATEHIFDEMARVTAEWATSEIAGGNI